MTKDMPLVGVTLSPYVQPNTDWYARSVLKTTANTPTSTAPSSLSTSIGNRTYAFSTKRGRTYDLGRTEAGTLDLRVDNTDGALNPLNSSNNLYPFCPVRVTCAYPKTGNILNDTNQGYIGDVTAVVTAASSSGGVVTYTANNTFQLGQQVSVTGLSSLNLTSKIITGATSTTFSVNDTTTGSVTGASGSASLDLPATWADYAVSVCANDSNFDLGRISNWYTIPAGTNVTASNTYAHTGTYSMRINSSSTAFLDVPCVAGQTVTLSAWVRTGSGTTGGAVGIYAGGYIDATASPTLTSYTTNTTWTRYSVTVTTTSPKITVVVKNTGGNFTYVDDVQVEFGSTATTNTTIGSTIYNLFNGFVERFPQSFQAPNRGEVNMAGTDAVALMSQNTLTNPYSALVLQDPNSYLFFPFSEANNVVADVYKATYSSVGGTTITYQSINSFVVGDLVTVTGMGANNCENLAVTFTDGVTFKVFGLGSGTTYGAGTATATRVYSQSGNAYANTIGVGYTFNAGKITLAEQNSLVGFNGQTNINFSGTSSDTAEIAVAIPSGVQSAVGSNFMLDVLMKWTTSGKFLSINHADGTSTQISLNASGYLSATRSGAGTATQTGTNNIVQAGTWRLFRCYYNGTRLYFGIADYDAATGTSVFNYTFTTLVMSASNVTSITLGSIASGFNGSFAGLRYGAYNTLNQGSAISKNLFQVAWSGYFGATTGSRFADVMQNYSGFDYTPIATDLGVNHSGSMVLSGRTLQDVVQVTSDTEQGYWYVDGSGFVTFKDQLHRKWTTPNLTPVKFADNATDVQYEGGSLQINYDLTFVYNQVTVSCAGANYYAEDNTSINRYYPRTLQLTTENAYPSEVSTLASTLLAKYQQPQGRLETITFTPMRNPAIWGPILGLEVGDYVQITRTPYGQSAITFNGWVEQIEHNFDGQTGDWVVHVNVSPHLPTA